MPNHGSPSQSESADKWQLLLFLSTVNTGGKGSHVRAEAERLRGGGQGRHESINPRSDGDSELTTSEAKRRAEAVLVRCHVAALSLLTGTDGED